MEKKPKKLGLNCSDFEHFITENRIYVDKTQHIYNLITDPDTAHFYFVSRPRRFGKSLFISTLHALFSGKKELFKEYWIGKQSNYDWPTHPIIHLDFGGIAHGDASILKKELGKTLDDIAEQSGITIVSSDEPERKLIHIVKKLREQNSVVLLVDEYDKPLLDNISDPLVVEEIRKILNGFYATIKSLEKHWRAIVITGVTKFARTSLFSGLNNLEEISFKPIAAELFGYTQTELVTHFDEQIDALALHAAKTKDVILSDMKTWYDGYRFCKDMQKPQMYNPLSVVECLKNKEFSNYWINTATPTFLITLLRQKGLSLDMHTTIQVSMQILDSLDLQNIPLHALLVHTGYLTIVDYNPERELFTLDYPNKEVKKSCIDYLLQAFAYTTSAAIESEIIHMQDALADKDFALFCNAIKTLLAGIPHNLHIAKESYYHSLLHFMFDLLGMRPQSEVASSRGRADLILETPDSIIVFEFKYNDSAQAALNQIRQKKYYEQYTRRGKAIILVGIAIDFGNKELKFEWVQENI